MCKPKPGPKPQLESKSKPGPKSQLESKSKPGPKPQLESKPMPKPMPKPKMPQTVFKSKSWFVEHLTDEVGGVERDIVRHPGSVVILPLLVDPTTHKTSVVFVENYRVAIERTFTELPAGKRNFTTKTDAHGRVTFDWIEPAVEAAKRELKEETGFKAGSMIHVGSIHTTIGLTDEEIHMFIARDLEPGKQDLQQGEVLKTKIVPVRDAYSLLDVGVPLFGFSHGRFVDKDYITDAKTVVLLMLHEFHTRCRSSLL